MNPMSLYAVQGGKCFICGKPMLPTSAGKNSDGSTDDGWTRDHVIPLSRGGRKHKNLVLAHKKCNSRKGSEPPTDEMVVRCRENYGRAKRVSRAAPEG